MTQAANDPQKPSAEGIQAWLTANLAETLGIDPHEIDIHEPLESYGLSSRDAVSLTGDLEDWLSRRVSPTLVWEYPTIEAIAHHLSGDALGDTAQARPVAQADAAPLRPATTAAELAEMSDEEAEALLLQRLTDLGQ